MEAESLAFDRAAEYYDDTRALLSETMAAVTEMLTAELDGQHTLEVGVGTGRIALPLHQHGIAMAGIDLSLPMLQRLVAKAGGRPPFPIAAADATILPFPDDSFEASVACHVLHLIPKWPVALDELIRVVKREGLLLIDYGGWQSGGRYEEIFDRLCAAAGIVKRHRGMNDWSEIDAALEARGASLRRLPVLIERRRLVYSEVIEQFEAGIFSVSWKADAATRRQAAEEVRAWLITQVGDLGETFDHEGRIAWRAYDLP